MKKQKLTTPPQQKDWAIMVGSTCYVAKAVKREDAVAILKANVKVEFDEDEVYQKD